MPPEVIATVADFCDLQSVLNLRLTSSELGEHAENVLDADRRAMLRHFVTDAEILWEHFENYGAVVGGLAALSFVLRDASMLPDSLDVFVTMDQAEFLEQMLDEDPDLDLRLTGTVDRGPSQDFITPRHTSRVATFLCPNGRLLKLCTLSTQSVLDPIVVAPTTALMNWVSPHAFGCAYPTLTLKRRALSGSISAYAPGVAALYLVLKTHGFERMRSPWCWPEYAALVPPSKRTWFKPCLSALFLCPQQGRFFGDEGSLINVFDLQSTNHDELRTLHQPPYGVSVGWRLWFGGQRGCDGHCKVRDPLLPEGVVTVAAVMVTRRIQFRATFVDPRADV
ncbi:hypothetical protein TRAPUB_1403 [Trametes pubescens]|uniref:F-box domain-containing protein n=1 Tax=Trametes pubescens TaxID=154538 RepID=A0A1M2VJD0_TRAPU|nr:hypothetical protein TRAPUB_1403 [Trametes pubescens]